MATVVNKDGSTGVIDPSLTTHNRTVAAEPNAVTTPEFSGEIVYDTTNNCYWKAMAADDNHWVMLSTPGP